MMTQLPTREIVAPSLVSVPALESIPRCFLGNGVRVHHWVCVTMCWSTMVTSHVRMRWTRTSCMKFLVLFIRFTVWYFFIYPTPRSFILRIWRYGIWGVSGFSMLTSLFHIRITDLTLPDPLGVGMFVYDYKWFYRTYNFNVLIVTYFFFLWHLPYSPFEGPRECNLEG